MMQLQREAGLASASASSSASSAKADLKKYLLTVVCHKYTAYELKVSWNLDEVMQVSIRIAKR
jgi:hypothetical protein